MHIFVFGYGSLMNPDSAARTLGRKPRMSVARLYGYRTAWNVASRVKEGKNLGRIALRADGVEFDGLIVPLGLEQGQGYTTTGTVFAVSARELALLDEREVNYTREPITDKLRWLSGVKPRGEYLVYTYVPKQEAIETLQAARLRGLEPVVVQSYLKVIEAAVERHRSQYAIEVPVPEWSVTALSFVTSDTIA